MFDTNIRFIGGLLSTYYLTGDGRFIKKAHEIASILLPAFETKTGLPFSLYNPSTGQKKNYAWASSGCSVSRNFSGTRSKENNLNLFYFLKKSKIT